MLTFQTTIFDPAASNNLLADMRARYDQCNQLLGAFYDAIVVLPLARAGTPKYRLIRSDRVVNLFRLVRVYGGG